MKKLIALLAALVIMTASAALAEDLTKLTDDELLALLEEVRTEIENRNLLQEKEADPETEAVLDRLVSFFQYWSANDLDGMLTLCTSDWLNSVENAKMSLFRILENRTPQDLTCDEGDVYGGTEDPVRRLEAVSRMDRHNGLAPVAYRFQVLMQKQEDGLWYVNPQSLTASEIVTEELPAPGATDAPDAGETLLYWNSNGGEYYHLDPDCKRVHPSFRPLQESFPLTDLDQEAYRDLKPCEVCGAPERESSGKE